ncbi:MAG: DUF1801 domain-containing protein [Ardenticatenaceae bacterium]|nr:DUF1801 domain-containing protein [Ardenticatenaceae bacterium]
MNVQVIDNPEIQYVFDQYAEKTRQKLMRLRQLILTVASETEGVGTIEETLKWGQISYLTHNPKSGTTIRIDEYQPDTQQIACFVHCQTNLVDTFRHMYPDAFRYEGNRAVIWDELDEVQGDVLKQFIELALTYHQRKRGALQ